MSTDYETRGEHSRPVKVGAGTSPMNRRWLPFAILFSLAWVALILSTLIGEREGKFEWLAVLLTTFAIASLTVSVARSWWRRGCWSRVTVVGGFLVGAALMYLAFSVVSTSFNEDGRSAILAALAVGMAVLLLVATWVVGFVAERQLRFAFAACVTLAFAIGALQFAGMRPTFEDGVETNRASPFGIVAMGDSYISGEGAEAFINGTDSRKTNRCHQAPTAYPQLVAKKQSWDFTFLACSGARTFHIVNDVPEAQPQYRQLAKGSPGAVAQIEQLALVKDPEVVLISIGGNDAGFANLATACVMHRCHSQLFREKYIRNLRDVVEPLLEHTFARVREVASSTVNPRSATPQVAVFAMTYPDPFGKDCEVVGIEKADVAWIRNEFLVALNGAVRSAAERAHIQTIALDGALIGHGVCDNDKKQAINVATWGQGNDPVVSYALTSAKSLISGSFHPNPYGHTILANPVEAAIERLRQGLIPARYLAPATKTGSPRAPSEDPIDVLEAEPFPVGTKCDGSRLDESVLIPTAETTRRFKVGQLKPRGRVCFRTENGSWKWTHANKRGFAEIPVPRSATQDKIEIVAHQASGRWYRIYAAQARPGVELDEPRMAKKSNAWTRDKVLAALGTGFSALCLSFLVLMLFAFSWWAGIRERVRL